MSDLHERTNDHAPAHHGEGGHVEGGCHGHDTRSQRKIELTIVTTSGTVNEAFDPHDTFKTIEERVFNKLGIVPSPNDNWQLTHGETVLAPSQTIESAHLPNHARLRLAPKEGGGGSTWTSR